MINFRFHIVSLTAVLLSLGLGLVLGTAFLDDALIGTLRNQLDGLESDLDRERERASDQRRDLALLEEEHDALNDELGGQVLGQHLEDEPVLVIVPEGVEGQHVSQTMEALDDADAEVVGTWELTRRFRLDDDEDVADLAGALDLSIDNPTRLRDNVLDQMGDVLYGATDAADSSTPELSGLTGGGPAGQESTEETGSDEDGEFNEPQLLAALTAADFIRYDLPEGSDADVVELPAGNLRVLVVSGPAGEIPHSVLHRVLTRLASEGRVPVVVASPVVREQEDDEEDGDEDEAVTLVSALREDDDLAGRISTVDNLDRAAGKVATVLALQAAKPGDPHIGDYGQGDGAERLLPPPAADR